MSELTKFRLSISLDSTLFLWACVGFGLLRQVFENQWQMNGRRTKGIRTGRVRQEQEMLGPVFRTHRDTLVVDAEREDLSAVGECREDEGWTPENADLSTVNCWQWGCLRERCVCVCVWVDGERTKVGWADVYV